MFNGDKVSVAEISGGAVAARASVVVGIELDKAVAALSEKVERQQTHFVRQLPLHIVDDRLS